MQSAKQIIQRDIAPFVAPDDWKSPGIGDEYYSADQLIAAYLTGIKTGEENADRAIQKQYRENLTQIGKDTQTVVELLHRNGFTPVSAILKIVNIGEFVVLITLPEEDLLRNSIDAIYREIGNLIKNNSNESYTFDVILAGRNESFNLKKVSSDGFKLYHKSLIDSE